jgi:hypothetical protein
MPWDFSQVVLQPANPLSLLATQFTSNLCWFVPSSGSPYCQIGSKGFGMLARQYSTSNLKPRAKKTEKKEHQTLLEKKQLAGKKNRPLDCSMSHEK